MNLRSFGLAILTSLPIIMASSTSAFAAPPAEGAEGPAEAGASGDASLSLGGDAGAEGDAGASGDAAAPAAGGGGGGSANASTKDRGDQPWIKRWAPEPHMVEIGLYGGAFFPSKNHELFQADLDLPQQGYKQLKPALFDIGGRIGYYPLRFFGIEAEAGVMPAPLAEGSGEALAYHARAHLIAQLGLWSVTPFVVLGGGGLGVASPRAVLGQDIDPSLHFGAGLKIYINRNLALRLDVRDNVSHKTTVEQAFRSHNPEFLLGVSLTLGRKKDEKPSDRDGDGIVDTADTCPDDPETVNSYQDEDGCPESDRDGDGFWDDQDTCPDAAETVNGYQDEDGCPESDRDGDGFFDELDKCPDVPESENGYQDDDGCDDEVPKEVQAFTGTIKGITFENDSDKIRKSSTKTLDGAVEVLKNNPDVKIKVNGHTDNKGDRDHNMDLSQRRAASVKTYLVEHGVDEARIVTEGFGPDKPVDTNDTSKGRANNRRIEFEIITRKR